MGSYSTLSHIIIIIMGSTPRVPFFHIIIIMGSYSTLSHIIIIIIIIIG